MEEIKKVVMYESNWSSAYNVYHVKYASGDEKDYYQDNLPAGVLLFMKSHHAAMKYNSKRECWAHVY